MIDPRRNTYWLRISLTIHKGGGTRELSSHYFFLLSALLFRLMIDEQQTKLPFHPTISSWFSIISADAKASMEFAAMVLTCCGLGTLVLAAMALFYQITA